MKKRILALLLCCTLLLGLLPAAFTAAADADASFRVVDASGAAVSYVEVPQNGKFALTAQKSQSVPAGAYQWQISVPGTNGVWANILDAQGSTLELSYAMVANMLQSGLAYVRCRLTTGEQTLYTDAVSVAVGYAAIEQPAPMTSEIKPVVISEAQPIGQPVLTPAAAPAKAAPLLSAPAAPTADPAPAAPTADPAPAAPAADPAPAADETPASDPAPATDETPAATEPPAATEAPTEPPAQTPTEAETTNDSGTPGTNDAPTTYSIVINYVFTDGTQAAPSWTATVATGSTYQQNIASPVVLGYTPDRETVSVDASKETTYTVTYKPAEVNFTVKHFQQNVDNDNYALVDTETKKGYTKAAVGGSLAKPYEGFTALLYDTTTEIAADGSTVVEVYYDRNYYLMNFDLDGGYGVEPIYGRYGAPISIGDPQKAGYTFTGWDKEIPDTMPAENSSFKANWKAGTSGFTVVFWYENADDDDYSVAGTYTPADVAPGTEKKSDEYKNQSFTGRDDTHFTYNAEKAETVTVKGDGSAVLNVYYTRNTYTLTFTDGTERVLTCGKEEHTHTYDGSYNQGGIWGIGGTTYYYGGCYPAGGRNWGGATSGNTICGKEEHTHSNSCYSNQPKVVKAITAKYDEDISGEFKKAPFTSDYNGRAWECTDSSKYNYALQTLDRMPGFDATFNLYRESSDTKKTIYYYVQKVGATVDAYQWPSNANNFDLHKQVDTYFNYATYDEEYHEIQGYTRYSASVAGFDYNEKDFSNNRLDLYYMRNSYTLKFYNHDGYVAGADKTVQYEAPLSGYDFTLGYPAGLEPNAYVFAGWYTTAGCYEGSEANLSNMTMPASDVILYAKWVPKTHTVKTYLTEDVVGKEESVLNTWEKVPHGTSVEKPKDPENGQYTFVGWFYTSDTGEEKAFDFSMPVNRDLNLYAKWSSNTLMEYTIHYQLEDGTQIADDTTGSALAGTTKTFDAKTGTQLNEGYQSGYFPKTSSHSLTLNIEGGNEFTFVYVPKAEVNYTVRYLEKGTDIVLHPEKKVATRDAVITEKFEQITGYAPDAYQKRLVLSADEESNVITFWYVKDDAHAPVQIIHWTQNIAGDGYTEYQSSTNLNGMIGQEYTENPLEIPGFTYNKDKSNASGTLTAEGLVLNLYYDRIEYPYEFRFLEQGTDTQLAAPVTGSARYQAQVTQDAKTIPGYKLVTGTQESQAITIAIEDPENVANKNVKTFYYVEETVDIKYQVVGPTGSGTLDSYQDNGVGVINGTVNGSAPTAADGYKFVGWFKDDACTQPVDAAWVDTNSKLTPQKTKNYGTEEAPVDGYEAATYYAKFEYDVADLTITKQGWDSIDENQSFIFNVTGNGVSTQVVIHGNGSVTIKGLKIGTYTVTEVTNWSWRYDPDSASQSIELKPVVKNEVTFANTRTQGKWLSGDSFADNKFTK